MAVRKAWRLLLGVLLAAGLVNIIAPAAFAAAIHDVTIENFAYAPPVVTVAVGDTVRWTSNDFTTHTATGLSGPAPFDTGFIADGQSASVLFTTLGSYEYFCQIHPGMCGTVTVQTVPDPVVPEAPLPALIGGSMMIALIFFMIRSSKARTLIA